MAEQLLQFCVNMEERRSCKSFSAVFFPLAYMSSSIVDLVGLHDGALGKTGFTQSICVNCMY